ncbi:unnamed protein product [Brassica napus]|uniref:(rape) hypothetical protein n=1 Tax=Brassica napus TaxID=3708 RepID=A0A816JC34_BRANA|nr:unnamed protein product [Brassica napus]
MYWFCFSSISLGNASVVFICTCFIYKFTFSFIFHSLVFPNKNTNLVPVSQIEQLCDLRKRVLTVLFQILWAWKARKIVRVGLIRKEGTFLHMSRHP